MRRLQVSMIVFILSWYITILGVDLFVTLGLTGTTLAFFQSNMVLFALTSYTQSFYVALWRSSEYRVAFCKMWSCCLKSSKAQSWMETTVGHTSSLPSHNNNNNNSTIH
uniref:G-protein coupled receptors family 1 profile domain-containing protein n=1 Tax=Caenorhabditis japonica TaxID=281687 RepID=A0A8R1DYR6_CAEJA